MPFKYRITYLAAAMWPGEQLLLYCERMLVIVAMSGRVMVASQVRLPTSSCNVLLSLHHSDGVMSMWGTESTGKPLR